MIKKFLSLKFDFNAGHGILVLCSNIMITGARQMSNINFVWRMRAMPVVDVTIFRLHICSKIAGSRVLVFLSCVLPIPSHKLMRNGLGHRNIFTIDVGAKFIRCTSYICPTRISSDFYAAGDCLEITNIGSSLLSDFWIGGTTRHLVATGNFFSLRFVSPEMVYFLKRSVCMLRGPKLAKFIYVLQMMFHFEWCFSNFKELLILLEKPLPFSYFLHSTDASPIFRWTLPS